MVSYWQYWLKEKEKYVMPVRKCLSKTRTGSKIKKNYDESRPPYRRVLEFKSIDDKIKAKPRKVYDGLNPAELKRKITSLQNKLLKLNALKHQVLKDGIERTRIASFKKYLKQYRCLI